MRNRNKDLTVVRIIDPVIASVNRPHRLAGMLVGLFEATNDFRCDLVDECLGGGDVDENAIIVGFKYLEEISIAFYRMRWYLLSPLHGRK